MCVHLCAHACESVPVPIACVCFGTGRGVRACASVLRQPTAWGVPGPGYGCRVGAAGCCGPDTARAQVVVWKRYSDLRKLHGDLAYTHRHLFRRLEDFPAFPKAQVFGKGPGCPGWDGKGPRRLGWGGTQVSGEQGALLVSPGRDTWVLSGSGRGVGVPVPPAPGSSLDRDLLHRGQAPAPCLASAQARLGGGSGQEPSPPANAPLQPPSGRFEPEVIEERRQAAETMLRFTVPIPALTNSPQLKEFFRVGAWTPRFSPARGGEWSGAVAGAGVKAGWAWSLGSLPFTLLIPPPGRGSEETPGCLQPALAATPAHPNAPGGSG